MGVERNHIKRTQDLGVVAEVVVWQLGFRPNSVAVVWAEWGGWSFLKIAILSPIFKSLVGFVQLCTSVF